MPTASAGNGGSYKIPEAGNRPALCFAVVATGTQERSFQGQAKSPAAHVRIGFELCGEDDKNEDGSRMTIWSKAMMLNLSDKASLTKMINSWRGVSFTPAELERFDVGRVLGAACLLNVVINSSDDGQKKYANIDSVTQLVKGMPKPAVGRTPFTYEIEHGPNDVFNGLPDFIKKEIYKSAEAMGGQHQWPGHGKSSGSSDNVATEFGGPASSSDDEVPF